MIGGERALCKDLIAKDNKAHAIAWALIDEFLNDVLQSCEAIDAFAINRKVHCGHTSREVESEDDVSSGIFCFSE